MDRAQTADWTANSMLLAPVHWQANAVPEPTTWLANVENGLQNVVSLAILLLTVACAESNFAPVRWGAWHFAVTGRTNLRKQRIQMAAKKKTTKKKAAKAKGPVELIISKSRTKAAVKKSNVSSEFYGALDAAVRGMIAGAEGRASANGRKTLRPQDL